MSLFAWANSKLEQLSEQLAPIPNDPAHRFSKACASNDPNLALQLLSPTPPPLPDGTQCSPVDPFKTIINRQKGSLAIHCAAEFGQMNVVQNLIVQFGVNAEQFDHQGNTPLHYAASSRLPAVLNVIKFLVNEYNVSVILKNMHGKTAYDLATQDSVRQFLLPIQLQKETQECIDNGGRGLPDGADLGGMTIKRDIAPPPIIAGFGSPPPMGAGAAGINNYSAAALGTPKYAVPTYGQEPPQQPGMGADAGAPHDQNQYLPQEHQSQPQPIMNMGVNLPVVNVSPQPSPVAMPNNGNPITLVEPVPVQTPYAVSESVGSPMVTEQVSPSEETTNAYGAVVSSSEPTPGAKPTEPAGAAQNPAVQPVSDANVPAGASPAMDLVPVQPVDANPASEFSYGSNVAAPSIYGVTPAPFSSPVANISPVQTPVVAAAPTSDSSYARRGFSTAAVLPKNSKYKPDGFHSSSSDTSLQKKYGHDSSITGPPSGTYSNTNIAPPPTAVTGAGPGFNPYASSSPFGTSAAVTRIRYPTYDAISDTVGDNATGGGTGYNYNPYAADAMQGQYNVYNPQQQQQQQQQQYHQPAYDYSLQPTYDYGQQQQSMDACPWKAATAPDGRTYYYNEVTSESTWDVPAELQNQQPANHQQYRQNTVASPSYADVSQPVAQLNDVVNPIQEQAPVVVNQTVTAKEPQPIAQSAEMTSVVQEPATLAQESSPVASFSGPAEEPIKTPAAQQTQEQISSFAAAVIPHLQNMNVGGPVRQTSTASAAELFGSPVLQSSISYASVGQSTVAPSDVELLSPIPASDVQPEVKQIEEDDDDSDGSLSPPPIAFEEPSTTVEKVAVAEAEDDDFLSPPPFGGDSNNDNDPSGEDDLPPPPMMDISLSE